MGPVGRVDDFPGPGRKHLIAGAERTAMVSGTTRRGGAAKLPVSAWSRDPYLEGQFGIAAARL